MKRAPATAKNQYQTDEEKGSISVHFVREALAVYRDRQPAAVAALLIEAGITPEVLDSPKARISPATFGTMWRLMAQTFDDEFFGMDSHPMKAGSFTMLCNTVIHCATLEHAIHRALRFLHLTLDDIEGKLVKDEIDARIVVVERQEFSRPFIAGTLLLIIHGLACWLVGRHISLAGASFRSPEPAFADEWKVIFSPQVRFDQDDTAISFSNINLALPNIRNERSLKRFLRDAPANFLVKYRNSDGVTASVRRHLKRLPPLSWPGFELLAKEMHTSTSTLRRRLEQEGQSYRSIRNDLRYDLALDHLSQSALTISEIAQKLGFAEPSAFHRAFQKWAGASPGAYRRRWNTA